MIRGRAIRDVRLVVTTGAACGLGLGVLDLLISGGAPTTRILAMLALFVAAGAACGLGLLVLGLPLRIVPGAKQFSLRRLAVAAYIGGIAFFAARYALRAPSSFTVYSGSKLTTAVAVLAVGITLAAYLRLPSLARDIGTRRRIGWALAGVVAIAIDRLVLVSLYERAHIITQAAGFAALTAAIVTSPSLRGVGRLRSAVASIALLWLVLLAGSSGLRARLDANLPTNAEGKRVYLGRLVRQVRVLEAIAQRSHPSLPAGAHHLASRYEIHDTRLDEGWTARVARAWSPIESSDALPWNVVFFFVDTLRADVASDDTTMPATAAWMREHVSFSRAYAPASSTLLSLAPLLSCRYDAKPDEYPALLQLAGDRGMARSLFIPQRASGYHRIFFPTFRFDHEDVVEDSNHELFLTGDMLVDRALSWIKTKDTSTPFFMWLYDFDVHEWPNFPDRPLEEIADDARLSKTEGLPWRYRAAAHAVDRSFARLRNGLQDLGLLNRTVIVFLADHGEGLGEHGQWAHSTYLWENLVRVPLAVEAPGFTARQIDTPVSLVDLPTTLSRFIGPVADEERCHGEDMLADEPPTRRLPILLSAMLEGSLVRVGLLDSAEKKLVVDLREGHARLYDLPGDEESVTDAPAEAARLLDLLVRSPLYPRID